MSFPILTSLVVVPAAGSLAIAALSQRRPEWIKLVAVLVSVFTGALSVWALSSFETAAAYCDELVDGAPRFTLDYVIDTQRPAIDTLRDMLWKAMIRHAMGYFEQDADFFLNANNTGLSLKDLTIRKIIQTIEQLERR